MTSLLQVQNVGVQFGGLVALAGVDMDVRRGEVHALIGPNGAGKSTLINCIMGYQKPTQGVVSVDGRDIKGLAPASIARLGVARTFQTPQLFGRLTVRDNVRLALSPREPRRRALDLIEQFGLLRYADTLSADLPHGQQRLLELARALATRPKLLLADEPAAGLTSLEDSYIVETLRSFAEASDSGVLLVEHNVGLVRRAAHRISVLHRGVVIATGEPEAVLAEAEVIEAYLGVAAERAA